MNLYIYDDFLNKSRYNKAINRIEIRLTDLGLNGKIIRLGTIKNINSLIQQEIRNGVKNVVAVGNNKTANKVITALIKDKLSNVFSQDILFSLIPVGDNQSIAKSLGIKKEEDACNIILARRIEKIDIGVANSYYFINKVEQKKNNINIKFKDYTLETLKSPIFIYNLNDNPKLIFSEKIKPDDGSLDLVINENNNLTYLPIEKIQIFGDGEILLDESIKINLPSNISILKKRLQVIVGKDRFF
jgi:hypothetical protein